ncbi:MAG: hypothetical protein HOO09_08620, partial [Rhodospirillaceae bacterium]|nr:hypothetical protein [Rhodospirillaceae bacterium]
MLSKSKLLTMTSALALTAFAGEAAAQQMALEEIVVTSRKMNESIQDIPLSVTAFSAEMISKQQITDIEDLLQFTPG